MPTGDQADVLLAFDELFDALLSRRDADEGAGLFLEEADTVMWGSEQHERSRGRPEIEALQREIASFAGEIAFRWHQRSVHVERDVAWVNADGEVTVTPAGAEPRKTPYRLTAVFGRRDGRWRWHTFHGSEPNA